MSVVILGGNECMEREYSNVCRKYGCKAKVFCKPCADMRSRIGTPDLLIVFTHTISHKMVRCALTGISGETKIVRSHTSSMNSLKDILKEHTAEPGQDICDDLRWLNRLLGEKGIRVVLLRKTDKKALLYLYRPDYLERDLGRPEARQILLEKGYCCDSTGNCIVQLIRHMTEDDEFPHEVGLFLGYPPRDVQCFMEDSRRGVKCTGCWKAYGNEEEARKTFLKFRKCKEVYRRELSKGKSLLQLTVRTDRKRWRDFNNEQERNERS